ncbi:MAG: glycosyltransferase family protein [Rhodothermales bacterium]
MAKIVYSLSGQGRGHTSRVIAVSDELRKAGHEVVFCCGGTAREILEAEGERVLPVPALRQAMHGNAIHLTQTFLCNWRTVLSSPLIVAELATLFSEERADLLITDFEAFSPHAARRIGLPVLSFNHQQVVTETVYDLPASYRFNAAFTGTVIRFIAPRDPQHVLLSSFFFPPLKHPGRTTLVAPIIRPDVQAITPKHEDPVLVYYNQTQGAGAVLDVLRQVDARFIVYNFDPPPNPEAYPNLTFKAPCLDGFLRDLARSRAVICTAGFTLISEALFLGKPLLVVPNRGIFEQTLNALFLQREGLGEAVIGRPVTLRDIATFLGRSAAYRARMVGRDTCGNKAALACIERVLSENLPDVHAHPDHPYAPPAPLTEPVERLE